MRLCNIQERREELVITLINANYAKPTNSSGYIIFGTFGGIIGVWDLQEEREEPTLPGHAWSVCRLAKTSDSKYIISADSGGTAKIWNTHTKRQEAELEVDYTGIESLAITSSDKYAVFCAYDGTIRVWRIPIISFD